MPEYRTIQAWIDKENNFIFIGYRERLEDVLKEVDKNNVTVISETSQKRLAFKLRDLARKNKEHNGSVYSVKFYSGLATLDNIIRVYSYREGLFKKSMGYV